MNLSSIKSISFESQDQAEEYVKNFLYENSDPSTVIFLSGGKTPRALYDQVLLENKLKAGAFAMIDERYGAINHELSNALILKHFSPMYPILNGGDLETTASEYDETVRYLFNYFPKSIGILGIGIDGHIAGIPAIPHVSEKILEDRSALVVSYDAQDGFYNKRITMTFAGLAKLDHILVMAFGEEKKEALLKMYKEGPVSEIPARFLKEPEIAPKVILVTDQEL